MPIEILMPALSPTMTEGNLATWLKKEGDTVEAGDVLAEIETDKATMEVEAVDEGVLGKIMIPAGSENVPVNQVIALLLEEDEDASALEGYTPAEGPASETPAAEKPAADEGASDAPEPTPEVTAPVQGASKDVRVKASPLAKRIAADKGLDLGTISGSGPYGRIIKRDVEHAQPGQAVVSASGSALPTMPAAYGDSPYEDRPLSTMRKVIAKRLTESKQTVPHFYLSVDVELDTLLAVRKQLNDGLENEKITVNDFMMAACAKALVDVPEANASWMGDAIRYYQNADVAVAVAIPDGLITPIVKAANLKSLRQISAEVKTLVQKAFDGKLSPEEFQGGSFSVSNLGMYGISQFNAIVNPPQACILAVGAGQQKAIVKDGAVTTATVMTCTLSVDHRVVDGKVGAELLQALKKYLENPLLMMA